MTGIERLNNASRREAFDALLACCGSTKWAQRMVEARPFDSLAAIEETAARVWWELRPGDWWEAFAAHPKIGERKAASSQPAQSSAWSEAEQSGARDAAGAMLAELAAANRDYEERFGYIFIVCATGKSAAEMLALCGQRLTNDAETELRVAAEEQRKITGIRLRKLVGTER
jgi:OHCU decarboxylase